MKGTSPSQAIRAPSGLRFMANNGQDGEGNLFINSIEMGNHGYRNRWNQPRKNVFAVHGVDESGKPYRNIAEATNDETVNVSLTNQLDNDYVARM